MPQMYHCRECSAHFPEDRITAGASEKLCPICGRTVVKSELAMKEGVTLQELLDMCTEAELRIMETVNKEVRDIQYRAGVPVEWVEVELADITRVGVKKETAVSGVRIHVKLANEE